MNATDRANLWKSNRAVREKWMEDYGRRMGMTRDEIVRETQSHWGHDGRARKVGSWEGYEMSVCPMSDDHYRYTVVTPWGMNEGLCDLDRRDDHAAALELFATMAMI